MAIILGAFFSYYNLNKTSPMNLAERDKNHIWHPFTQSQIAPPPIEVESASGSYLNTREHGRLFDGISSWWTSAHGHCHPHIQKAISEQVRNLDHVIFANFTHEPAVRLAEMLKEVCPKGLARVFYCDSGSAAVEVALKMAFQYWQHKKEERPYFIGLTDGYHGDTFGAMAVSERSIFTKPFWPLLFNVLKSDTNKEALEALLIEHRGKVAGVIIEPMLQMAGGMKIFAPGFLRDIKELCVKYDALLIADEVATGFYRTGKFFACEHENIAPDIMCLAKGLTGGVLPLSATLATEEIFTAFLSDSKADALLHGHSFTANPIGCAAAIASLELFIKPEVKKNIQEICGAIQVGIKRFEKLPHVKDARSLGTIAIIELHSEHGYLSRQTEGIYQYCLKNGLYIRPLGDILYLMPPLCSTAQEVSWAMSVMEQSLLADIA